MEWADKYRKLKVRTNADTPKDAKKARELGAEGIGLCRTEHMFFDPERIHNLRRMIVSDTVEAREEALSKLLPYQKGDFKAMYKALEGRPMTVRYLDPPLHEFVPNRRKGYSGAGKGYGAFGCGSARDLRGAARVQSDDGAQGLPPFRDLSGDRADADEGGDRSGNRGKAGKGLRHRAGDHGSLSGR